MGRFTFWLRGSEGSGRILNVDPALRIFDGKGLLNDFLHDYSNHYYILFDGLPWTSWISLMVNCSVWCVLDLWYFLLMDVASFVGDGLGGHSYGFFFSSIIYIGIFWLRIGDYSVKFVGSWVDILCHALRPDFSLQSWLGWFKIFNK